MLIEKLFDDEIFWRDRFLFFREQGYILRPRYHPNWQASWKFKENAIPTFYKDSIFQWNRALMDATMVGDGKNVFIKRVDFRAHPNEARIAARLGSPENCRDETNHCVPISHVFSDKDPVYEYIVMPVLRPFNSPNFTSVGEVIDFVNQTLDGLLYMHRQNVAHRDCAAENILMDCSDLYKDGWHPMDPWRTRDGGFAHESRNRSEVRIKYYFIDFGLSTEFPPGQHDRLVTGDFGRIRPPEQESGLPYDAFKVDVYALGVVYQTKIVNVFKGLELLGSMVQLMTKPNPRDRPTAEETKTLWDSLQKLLPPRWTRLRIIKEEGSVERIVNNALDVVGMVRGSMGL